MRYFGQHPDFQKHFESCLKKDPRLLLWMGEKCSIEHFSNPLYPEVCLVSRNRHLQIADEFGEQPDHLRLVFPFSSDDLYIDIDQKNGVFNEIYHTPAFLRLGEISQLSHLIPPREKNWKKEMVVHYLIPQFGHTRLIHSLITAALAEIVLARNCVAKETRDPFVLAAAFHDVATPAGGDSIKRIDLENLCEEKNFSFILKRDDLAEKWKECFGFNLTEAQGWIRGEGLYGHLLDILDKISYTALDCFALGQVRNGTVRRHANKYPLIMDVWQDIRIKDGQVYFINPERLYQFLLLRAYEHTELLLNCHCRALDYNLSKTVGNFYEKGLITKDELLLFGDRWLERKIDDFGGEYDFMPTPDLWRWRRFPTEEKLNKFVMRLEKRLVHTERIRPFKTGLHWLVMNREGTVQPLRDTLDAERVGQLESLAQSVAGWYAYYEK
jgi:hypothetical protein